MENKNLISGNKIVDDMFKFESILQESSAFNLIPIKWYDNIRLNNGKSDMIACAILSEIVYWYRPKIIRDADTNQIVSTEPKFKADLLQKSYADLADKFCISKKQVTDAVSRLVTLDLIEREFRTITVRGNKIPNVLYLRLNVDRLIDITVGTASQGDNTFSLNSPIPLKKDMYIDQPADNCHSVTKGFTQEDYTNTDNTTNNTTEITPSTRTFTGDGELDQRKTIANNIHLKELLLGSGVFSRPQSN